MWPKGIYVTEEARRQLVADRLINHAKELAKAAGVDRMTVMTGEDNMAAQSLYRSLGFSNDHDFMYFALKLS